MMDLLHLDVYVVYPAIELIPNKMWGDRELLFQENHHSFADLVLIVVGKKSYLAVPYPDLPSIGLTIRISSTYRSCSP
jgi:hypothetical protein